MKTLFKTLVASLFLLSSTVVFAENINSNDIESSYIKCEMNEKGKLVPNYYVVVNGTSFKTDSKTFHLVQKAKVLEANISLSIDNMEMIVSMEKSVVAEK